jgi:hypothetical protein
MSVRFCVPIIGSSKLDLQRMLAITLIVLLFTATGSSAYAQAAASKNLAPGFSVLPKGSKIVMMPIDVELFSLSAGGVAEPKADWTQAAHEHMTKAISASIKELGLDATLMDETDADEFAEQVGLHAAVARAISLHHSFGGGWALPTKEGKLDWSFDDAMRSIQTKSGAKYGLFVWVRDSYASAERKATMVLLAIAGIGITGGIQVGYASLVDLDTGKVVWFNQLARASGDLREPDPAKESINALLTNFPKQQ